MKEEKTFEMNTIHLEEVVCEETTFGTAFVNVENNRLSPGTIRVQLVVQIPFEYLWETDSNWQTSMHQIPTHYPFGGSEFKVHNVTDVVPIPSTYTIY